MALANAGAARDALIDAATRRYRPIDRFAYHFARSKLRVDPVFTALLRLGLLSEARDILDLGCGIGLLESWLRSAHDLYAQGIWPRGWSAPPALTRIRGVDHDARDIRCAVAALGTQAEFTCADAGAAAMGRPDTVVILDMLHYLEYAAQIEVLQSVHTALTPGGVLITRVGDAGGGLRFKLSEWMDRAVLIARRGNASRLYCRPLAEWRALLDLIGFRSECIPMVDGTPFANQLLVARLR